MFSPHRNLFFFQESVVLQGTYNFYLVGLSLFVAIFASYTALDLAGRIRKIDGAPLKRTAWLAGGAASMGLGIWSMHFIGMLAFRMPIELGYDPWITGLSLMIAVLVSGFALLVVTSNVVTHTRLALGGVLMGLGVAAMHYTGMAAMRMHPAIVYKPVLFGASIGIAIAASWAALWIAFTLRDGTQRFLLLKRCAAGLVMGLAIAGMHYTAMSAAIFRSGSICGAASSVSMSWLAITVTGATLSVLTLTLVYSMLDARYDLQAFQLKASEEKARLQASLVIANERLQAMATRDSLTGLPNRGSLIDRVEQAIDESRTMGHAFTLMFMDLDGFKAVNDSLGHAAGDKLLKAFARQLVKDLRREDMVARLSGDEFVVLLDRMGRQQEVMSIAAGVLERMQQDFLIDGMPLRMTTSIGIATFPKDGESVEELLKNADTAMYAAKQNGRNTYRFFHSGMSEAAARTLQIHRGLTEALEKGHLSLRFQPKFRGIRNQLVGAEALIRWQHPDLGDIPPLDFLPVAERTGQIVTMGNWVIEEACRHLQRWREMHLPPVKIAINLSREQLRQPDYAGRVLAMTDAAGIDPGQIMFEITETAAMRDAELTTEVIKQFQRAGFDIAIADFGSGYSSLAYLQEFGVKQLKISRVFIEGLDRHGEEGYAMVSAIIALAHALEMAVVAEGVETPTQLERLKRLQCDEVQGYLLSRPLSVEDFERFLSRRMEKDDECGNEIFFSSRMFGFP
jgi:diguanylate cyclase (GGDEF)-like protein